MDYVVLDSPELSDVVELIKKYSRTHIIILYLNCEVVYDGRARSRLSFGNRIFISKPDGSPGCILDLQSMRL